MNQEESLINAFCSHAALFFVDPFLETHPNANLYLVGGAVRDALLHRASSFDFDFVITGLAQDDIEQWFNVHGSCQLVGERFGVFKFMPNGFTPKDLPFIDIALPRTETAFEDSLGGYRDFDVQSDMNLSIEEDLQRRDFTINAMAYDIRNKRLIDPFNGQMDLAQKVLRTVGTPEDRLKEDLSRILRGLRFASELEFVLEPNTKETIQTLLPDIHKQTERNSTLEYIVPRETIGLELAKAFGRNPAHAIKIFKELHAFDVVFPSLKDIYIKQENYFTPVTKTPIQNPTVAFALLLRGLEIEHVSESLRHVGLDTLSKSSPLRVEVDRVKWLVLKLQSLPSITDVEQMRASIFEKTFFNGKGQDFIQCLECMDEQHLVDAAKKRRQEIKNRWLVDHDESIAPLISGQDVLSQGVTPGPEVRIWLERVRDLQLDGKLMRREEAIEWIKKEQLV